MFKVFLFSIICFFSAGTYANTCQLLFNPAKKVKTQEEKDEVKRLFRIIPSGRDSDVIPIYEAFVENLYERGGVLDRLGIPKNKQIVEFMKGQDLNAVAKAGTGGYPISHYLDGAEVVKAMKDTRSLIFEVVYPGPDAHHAFYRDDNSVQSQLSILLHVIGHNHFATKSMFEGYRVDLGPRVSKQLDAFINKLYETQNKDEVQRWYLFLQSILPYQDFYTGYYQYTKQFEAKTPQQTYPDYSKRVQLGQVIPERHPLSSTENVLQAIAANIPPNAAPWKRQMAEMMVKLVSFQTALVHTQVMNEGWATFMQELLIKHMPEFNNMEYWLKAKDLVRAGHEAELQDPYWLGVNGWRRLYEKFRERADIRLLKDETEIDRRFVRYAEENFISRVDDFEFIRESIDDTWISQHKLAIVRRARQEEMDWNKQPPQGRDDVVQWIIKTRDAKRVVEHIIRRSVYAKFRFRPRLKLNDFTRRGSGDVDLVLDDQIGKQIPVKKSTLAPSLYTMAQILDKPVSLEAALSEKVNPFMPVPEPQMLPPWSWWPRPQPALDRIFRARIVVSPNGEVKVYRINNGEVILQAEGELTIATSKNNGETFDQKLTDQHALIMSRYLQDLYLEDVTKIDQIVENNPQFRQLAQQMVDQIVDSVGVHTMVDHVPSSARALMELKTMLERRTLKSLERAMTQGGGLINAGGRLFLKALPDAPVLGYDFRFIEKLFEDDAEEVYFFMSGRGAAFNTKVRVRGSVDKDEKGESIVTPIDGGDGSIVWGPGKKRKQPDEDDGEEPGDPGDKPGKKPGGPQPGNEPSDPSWVEIPTDLYAKYIGERIKLPNLRPKKGPSKNFGKTMRSRQNMRDGIMIVEDTFQNVLAKGIAIESTGGKDPLENLDDTLESGFAYLEPARDIVVKKAVPKPKPNINAVVTFVIDGSGSTANFFDTFKRFVFDLKVLINASYKKVEYRFVVFDTQAYEAKNETEFFKMRLGGGTIYPVGLSKVQEIQEANYPRDQWDRFAFVFGDLEDYAPPALKGLKDLSEETEFVGVVHGSDWIFGNPFVDGVKAMSEESPYVGFVDLLDRKEITVEDYRKLLKNDPE